MLIRMRDVEMQTAFGTIQSPTLKSQSPEPGPRHAAGSWRPIDGAALGIQSEPLDKI
jgi:hypothetical protein